LQSVTSKHTNQAKRKAAKIKMPKLTDHIVARVKWRKDSLILVRLEALDDDLFDEHLQFVMCEVSMSGNKLVENDLQQRRTIKDLF
jgi:hypothetical protein